MFKPRTKIILLTLLMFVFMMQESSRSDDFLKKPNVAGQFYSNNPQTLSRRIDSFFQDAKNPVVSKNIGVLLVPHAGYDYSGLIAAQGFKAVSRKKVKTIVILAASHHFGFDGASVYAQGHFETPLGLIAVDQEFSKQLIEQDAHTTFDAKIFEREHSLEVEIPFIQKTFADVKIVPVLFGQPSFETVQSFAKTLNNIVAQRQDVLVVVSTDLSHFHDGKMAEKMDAGIIELVRQMRVKQVWESCQLRSLEMCGFVPVTAALLFAQQRGLTDVDVLDYTHSGYVTGDNNRVVGYVAMIFSQLQRVKGEASDKGVSALNSQQQKFLLDIARQTIEHYLTTKEILDVSSDDDRLLMPEGAFVTLHKNDRLRGCIGNIIGRGPLLETVRDMAIAAATQDPRFSPVTKEEIKDLHIEISVLSVPRRAKSHDEIVMGTHGVIVRKGRQQGVFLPQVATETGWSKDVFLSELCAQKAHLPADAWKYPDTILDIFTAQVFSEK